MKLNKLNILALSLLAATLCTTSCTKDFDDINTNKLTYGPTEFDPNYALSTSQLTYTGSIDFAFETWRANLIYSGTMMQGLSSIATYWAGDKYLLDLGYTSSYWERAYNEQVKPIVDVVELTRGKEQYHNVHQVARIWKSLIFARITDLYGDIPYSEAGMGYYSKVLSTKYDKQEDIYKDMLKEIDEAVNALNPSSDKVTGDVIYGGDVEKWKSFGNSLILRLAMRLTKVDETTAKTYVTKVAGKTFSSNDENAFLSHDLSGDRITQNRNSQVLAGQDPWYNKWSKTFIDVLKNTNDPRIKVAASKVFLTKDPDINPNFETDPTKQKGMPNGKDSQGKEYDVQTDPNFTSMPEYSSPHPGMIKLDGITFILTYAECELLLAEAAHRWGIGGSAADHFAKGVKASITYLKQFDSRLAIPEADADAYVAANPLTGGIKQIAQQYWIHHNTSLNFYESWFNWRRTGYPELTPVVYPGNATNGIIPRRFPYPSAEEAGTNKEYYKAASAAVPGGDNLLGRVWWDKQ